MFAFPTFVISVLKTSNESIALNSLVEDYESNGNKPLTRRAYQQAIKRMEMRGILITYRHEQLYITSMICSGEISEIKRTDSIESPSMLDTKISEQPNSVNSMIPLNVRIHSAHKIKMSIAYKGNQPLEGGTIRKFGRYGSAKQVYFRAYKNISIISFKNTLNVWVHNPSGRTTNDQLIKAKTDAYSALKDFARVHKIELVGYLPRPISSHHVVDSTPINKLLTPLFKKYGEEIEARTGTKVCPSSHKGKIEHEGINRNGTIIQGSAMAIGFEKMFLELPRRIETIESAMSGFENYNKNIELHLGVLRKMSETLDEIKRWLKSNG
jgi:hypothetical protein